MCISLPTVGPFTEEMLNTSVTGVYTSTCCHPIASIIAVDQIGNTGFCELSAVTPVVNIKANFKYAELNVFVRETSKFNFHITNLGTKSSLSLQVSDNKYCIGYVTPLTLKMDHKEVVQCEVVLIGSKETGSNKTILVVEAVPLTSEINATRLLEIDVIVKAERSKPSLGWNVTADLDTNPLVTIQHGVTAVLNFTVTNNGMAGTFHFKVNS